MNIEGTIYIVDNDRENLQAVSAMANAMLLPSKAYTSGRKLLDELDVDRPGCIIAEIRIPDIGGLQLQQRLVAMGATTPVIFLTSHWSVPIVVRAMKAGAFNFFEKPLDEQSMWEAVQEAIYSDQERYEERHRQRTLERRLAEITRMEREVLDLVLQGMPNRVIAEKQGVSVRTVELRRSKLMEKLGAKSLAELVQIGLCVKRPIDHAFHELNPATAS